MRNALLTAALAAAGLMLGQSQMARASVFTGSFDTVYSDNFAKPAVNVNTAGVDPNSIAGNAPAVSTGLDGGTLLATYIGRRSNLPPARAIPMRFGIIPGAIRRRSPAHPPMC